MYDLCVETQSVHEIYFQLREYTLDRVNNAS